MNNETIDRFRKLNARMLNIATHIKMKNKLCGSFSKLTPKTRKDLDRIESWLNTDDKKLKKMLRTAK